MMNQKNTEQDKIKNATAASGRYSMHTMSFCTRLTPREAKTIREKLIAYCDAEGLRYHEHRNEWADTKELIFDGFLTYGLNPVKVRTISKNSGKIYYLQIKVNPRMMFHKDAHPFVYIADADDVRNSLDRVQDFLDMTDINEISKECFYIQRIDYCANIRLRSRYEVEEYMRLVRKGLCPYPTIRKEEYSETQKRWMPTQNSFTVCCKSYEFSVYDKQSQMMGENEKYKAEDIAEAEGIVRIELRVKRNKIRYEKKRFDYESEIEYLMKTAEISERLLEKHLRECFGTGCFVKASKAEEIIWESRYKDKTKERMCRIVRDTAKSGLPKARLRYGEKHNNFCDMMDRFNFLGISPITIRQRSEIECLDHPIGYIKDQNANLPR
ncbi:MAG: hypothetical protein HFH97_01370 [Lachnospiraceae bacterium]|nr:hypothetical protein [uncultured Acetatifactor sp.]MCI9571253.1 hypothetical protein [Lachnospiraceae bacterium]